MLTFVLVSSYTTTHIYWTVYIKTVSYFSCVSVTDLMSQIPYKDVETLTQVFNV